MAFNSSGGVYAPFADFAPKYWELELPVFPTGGENGKLPSIRGWNKRNFVLDTQNHEKWLTAFPKANLGMITGKASGFTVVDIDDDYPLNKAMAEFGETECIVRTPRGGHHLYYRYNGEKKMTKYQGRELDILGDGAFVMLPPSFNPSYSRSYSFLEGDLLFCPALNTLSPHLSLSGLSGAFGLSGKVSEGNRNTTLYNALREAYFAGDNSFDALLARGEEINGQFMYPPLPDEEVLRTMKSIWTCAFKENLVPPKTQYANLWEPHAYLCSPIAFKLYAYLKYQHNGLREELYIKQKAMAPLIGTSPRGIAQGIEELIEAKLIIRIYTGGKAQGDASIYKFARGAK